MKIIFCDSVIDNLKVDSNYELEFCIAQKYGFDVELFSFEEINNANVFESLKYIKTSDNKVAGIYRGWMMTPEIYTLFYNALYSRNIQLINSPNEYKHCHYLPESYLKIMKHTPKSVWTTNIDMANCLEKISDLESFSVVIKDFVKSEKHYWKTACFIPDTSNTNNVIEIIKNFLELRGSFLNKGLVFREYVDLDILTEHSKSKMPLGKEFRLFFLNKKLICFSDYWDEGNYNFQKPELQTFDLIAQNIQSNFFTMDIAKKKNGEWIIMELGDGQVAGISNHNDIDNLYCQIKTMLI